MQTIPGKGLSWKECIYSSVPEIHVSEGLGGGISGAEQVFLSHWKRNLELFILFAESYKLGLDVLLSFSAPARCSVLLLQNEDMILQ